MRIFILAVIILISACSSPYYIAESENRQGVTASKIGDSSYRIHAAGWINESASTVKKWTSIRASELCGVDNYRINDERNHEDSRTVYASSISVPVEFSVNDSIVMCGEKYPEVGYLLRGYPDQEKRSGLKKVIIYESDESLFFDNRDESLRIELNGAHVAALPAKTFIHFYLKPGEYQLRVYFSDAYIHNFNTSLEVEDDLIVLELNKGLFGISLNKRDKLPEKFNKYYKPYVI